MIKHRNTIHSLAVLPGLIMILAGTLRAMSVGETFRDKMERIIRSDVESALKAAGLKGEVIGISLPRNMPEVALNSQIKPVLKYIPEKAAMRTVLQYTIIEPGKRPEKVNAIVQTVAKIYGWVAVVPLKRGDDLKPGDFRREMATVTYREEEYYVDDQLLEGYELSTRLTQGQMLQFHHIKIKTAVKSGDPVMIYFRRSSGLTLISPGKVRRNGQIGDMIPVIATVTGKRLRGRLVSPGIVVVE